MVKLSDTQAQQYDDPNAGSGGGLGFDIKAWVKDRNLAGFPISIKSRTYRHVEDKYLPSGDFIKEHDEVVFAFEFLDNEDPRINNVVPDHVGVLWSSDVDAYGCSTRAARIMRVFQHLADEDFPVECVILADEYKKYNPLYLADPTTGGGQAETPQGNTSTTPAETSPTRPTTSGRQSAGGAPAQTGGRWQQPQTGGRPHTGTSRAPQTKNGGR